MSYKLSITKDEINKLPLYHFDGNIMLIDTEEDAQKAIDQIKDEKILGFDTETRPAFKKGQSYNICLLQLATDTHAYIFRLNRLPVMQGLIDILSDASVVKSGVGIQDDVKGLKKLFPFADAGFVDLATEAKKKKIVNFGLRALTAILLDKRLSKSNKISNWEKRELSPAQINYAAFDAVVGFEIYMKLCK
jgi:ribonuclease D